MSAETHTDDLDRQPQTPEEKQVAELKEQAADSKNGEALQHGQDAASQRLDALVQARVSSLPSELTPEQQDALASLNREIAQLGKDAQQLSAELKPKLDAIGAQMKELQPKLAVAMATIKASGIDFTSDTGLEAAKSQFPQEVAIMDKMFDLFKQTTEVMSPILALGQQSTAKMEQVMRITMGDAFVDAANASTEQALGAVGQYVEKNT